MPRFGSSGKFPQTGSIFVRLRDQRAPWNRPWGAGDRKPLDFPLKVGTRINADDDPKEGAGIWRHPKQKSLEGVNLRGFD